MVLVREDGGLSRVERAWSGPVVCIATGPSLTREQCALVEASGVPAVAVNDAYLWAPFAKIVYFADEKWFKWQTHGYEKPGFTAEEQRKRWAEFAGQKCSLWMKGKDYPTDVHQLMIDRTEGRLLSEDPRAVVTGSNSGYQALNVAALAGGDPIILVGYDCRAIEKQHHFFGEHPDKTCPPYEMIRGRYRMLAAEKRRPRILNATPGSALDFFEAVDLESVLPRP